ncbi:Tim22-complex subunit TIM54 [Aspergillus undulatus]|uniref:Tim22-complex subunit TIM54 n=1 Tax=Aspergillus undulatus TaxID=1810928 RepID=UPI003CCDB348
MADHSNSAPAAGEAAKSAPKPQNPAMRMMGMPNFRFKLPSRNWMIFLTVTGSFTAAIIYDRREKRRAQQKWCDLVAHISKQSLPVEETRRKLTVLLAAPPGDGIRNARDHFKEYVKPILVAAALDYDVVEGRREGDVRAAFAEQIRKERRRAGEPSTVVEEPNTESAIADARKAIGVRDEPGPKGDLIIGRHTWKEYIRGLHEGWLGPLDPPPQPAPEEAAPPLEDPQVPAATVDGNTEYTPAPEQVDEKKEEKKPTKPTGPTPAYIAPIDYPTQNLPPSLPSSLDGSAPIEFPHLLGFLNTPIRIYRYLNQRHVADSVGRDVAAVVLASYARPYTDNSSEAAPTNDVLDIPSSTAPSAIQSQLEHEEADWHKSAHQKDEANPEREREWTSEIVLDPRIASRMQRYALSPEEEARAQRIEQGTEYIIGEERPEPVSFLQRMWIQYGYGEDPEVAKRKPIFGNIDQEDA